MNDMYSKALAEIDTGNLRLTRDSEGHELFCYTKSCFFGQDTWNDITKTHRGQLYYNRKPVNRPFKKIFNLGEVRDTDEAVVAARIENEPFEVLDKVNGHLFIMSAFQDEELNQHIVFSTKGSLPGPYNDLLNDDILIFSSLYADQLDKLVDTYRNITLMFEAVVAHDKHSMYEKQVELYGQENCFVLLGASVKDDRLVELNPTIQHSRTNPTRVSDDPWIEADHELLLDIGDYINCPVVARYKEMEGSDVKPADWLEHKDREGYVIRFKTNNDRVKIKTYEYWKVRASKDLQPEFILSAFRSGGFNKIKSKFPEEIVHTVIDFLTDSILNHWYEQSFTAQELQDITNFNMEHTDVMSSESRKVLFTDDRFSHKQRIHILKGGNIDPDDTLYRDEYFDWAIKDEYTIEGLKEVVYLGMNQ